MFFSTLVVGFSPASKLWRFHRSLLSFFDYFWKLTKERFAISHLRFAREAKTQEKPTACWYFFSRFTDSTGDRSSVGLPKKWFYCTGFPHVSATEFFFLLPGFRTENNEPNRRTRKLLDEWVDLWPTQWKKKSIKRPAGKKKQSGAAGVASLRRRVVGTGPGAVVDPDESNRSRNAGRNVERDPTENKKRNEGKKRKKKQRVGPGFLNRVR